MSLTCQTDHLATFWHLYMIIYWWWSLFPASFAGTRSTSFNIFIYPLLILLQANQIRAMIHAFNIEANKVIRQSSSLWWRCINCFPLSYHHRVKLITFKQLLTIHQENHRLCASKKVILSRSSRTRIFELPKVIINLNFICYKVIYSVLLQVLNFTFKVRFCLSSLHSNSWR